MQAFGRRGSRGSPASRREPHPVRLLPNSARPWLGATRRSQARHRATHAAPRSNDPATGGLAASEQRHRQAATTPQLSTPRTLPRSPREQHLSCWRYKPRRARQPSPPRLRFGQQGGKQPPRSRPRRRPCARRFGMSAQIRAEGDLWLSREGEGGAQPNRL